MGVFEEIESAEIEVVNPRARSNAERVSALLHDDFQEFGSSGKVISKAQVLRGAREPLAVTYKLTEFSFNELSGACILATYRAETSYGHVSRRSSIWVKAQGQWQMLHHQSTPVL